MKLKEFTVREFKSVWDSGPIKIDKRVTCLVGKNESGKTALLFALYKTNPIIPEDAVFDLIYDYPKREVGEYRHTVENEEREEVVVVDCLYELDDDDLAVVTDVFGPKVLKSNELRRETFYGDIASKSTLKIDEQAARVHVASNSEFSIDLQEALKKVSSWEAFSQEFEIAEATTAVNDCQALVTKVVEQGLDSYIFNMLLWPRAPKYLYFDEYYQMEGKANLNALIEREDKGVLEGSDRPLIGLISLARLNLRDLVQTKNTTELKNELESASNFLTSRIMRYWSQNKHIQISFDVRDAKPEDPSGMRNGINLWGEINDIVHRVHTPLGSRSRGFVWFFSFLAWYEDVKRKKQNVILLLDEPGLSLHGRAQGDLLTYFEEELAQHQLVYSTHSPFMIDPHNFECLRIVQDLGIDSEGELPRNKDGTKVTTEVFGATKDSLFPLQGALGYLIHQTLFIGPNCLVVEGPSDMLYLEAVSNQFDREGRVTLSKKWTITPVGGGGKVPAYVALLAPQEGMNIATLLDTKASDRDMIADLYKGKLLKQGKVNTYADFLDQDEADVEDLFDREFYVSLVNKEFERQLIEPIEVNSLNSRIPRTALALEKFIDENPLTYGEFGHYRPARYFHEAISELWPRVSEETKNRFEAIFKKLNLDLNTP